MKIFSTTPIQYTTGDVLTPESYNTNISYLNDSNNDFATKRFTRWSNIYTFKSSTGDITDTSSLDLRTIKIPPSYNVNATSNLKYASVSAELGMIYFSPDGLKYFFGTRHSTISANARIYQYKLTIPFDETSIDLNDYSFNYTYIAGTNYRCSTFKPDGTKFYEVYTNLIYEYNLPTAWDLSTKTFVNSFTISVSDAVGLSFSEDGTALYYGSLVTSTTLERSHVLTTAWDISTAQPVTTLTTTGVYGGRVEFPANRCGGVKRILTLTREQTAGTTYGFVSRQFNTTVPNPATTLGSAALLSTTSTTYVPTCFYASSDGNKLFYGIRTIPNNGFAESHNLNTPYQIEPRLYIERIITTGYYTSTADLNITFSNFGTTNPDTIVLPISTDNTVLRYEFSPKRTLINSAASVPQMVLSSTGTFTINRLDVEIHYVTDRLYDPTYIQSPSLASPIAFDPNEYYVSESNSVSSSDVIADKGQMYATVNNNIGRQGATRIDVINLYGITASNTDIRIRSDTYPAATGLNGKQKIIAMWCNVVSETGAALGAVTIRLYRSLGATGTLMYYSKTCTGTNDTIDNTNRVINNNGSSLIGDLTGNPALIRVTSATQARLTLYIMYA